MHEQVAQLVAACADDVGALFVERGPALRVGRRGEHVGLACASPFGVRERDEPVRQIARGLQGSVATRDPLRVALGAPLRAEQRAHLPPELPASRLDEAAHRPLQIELLRPRFAEAGLHGSARRHRLDRLGDGLAQGRLGFFHRDGVRQLRSAAPRRSVAQRVGGLEVVREAVRDRRSRDHRHVVVVRGRNERDALVVNVEQVAPARLGVADRGSLVDDARHEPERASCRGPAHRLVREHGRLRVLVGKDR